MDDQLNTIKELSRKTETKILMMVMDGLGGLPVKELGGKTELEYAKTPNMDRFAKEGALGLHDPIAPGITPGSGPAHFALFGYDPLKWNMGRGVLETLGIGFELKEGDVAIRTNFCTLDEKGLITDRRAGRIPTSKCVELSELLDKNIKLKGVQTFIRAVRDYRGAVVLRGKGLGANVEDTDPQVIGKKPLPARPLDSASRRTAKLADELVKQAHKILKGKEPANGLLLRGFSKYKKYPTFEEIYKLNSACVAVYPMYKGVSKLLGMTVLDAGETLESEIKTLQANWEKFDFFFFHYKYTDSRGEDGDYQGKVKAIEEFDSVLDKVRELKPDVLIITGDHSTPSQLKSHSWHPVPFLMWGKALRKSDSKCFGESECTRGIFGRISALSLMPLAMAHAGKLLKFGA